MATTNSRKYSPWRRMLGDFLELAELQWKMVWLSIGEATHPMLYGLAALFLALGLGLVVLIGLMLCGVSALNEYGHLSMTASYGIASGVAVLGLVVASCVAGLLIGKAKAMMSATVTECEDNCNWIRQSFFAEDQDTDAEPTDYKSFERNRSSMYGLPPR